uniref:Profilin n=1 Tax=Compsopogon caeruleus TaxID=31354 RepID=A0A7S1TDT3_9RHOD|mmetsp:Transcript_18547/g.38929  ORF Transcript_18547/g.38929 Transcript_18547/m.38929 type:complete len:144 (+) Transcript_18547:169-600(+)|eukprot:CAMPEP_0184681424 /NCGR_PEP_ID=MMETSP0312-20130426/4403_1 /TAXON_ID=31354 /ORGANISM="Compsopogon coeruleus, Strain SAG 36.94" /LENGTH=143 /DNA_ID=CAMNT_0027132255 /DNA_START=165 /DNA_END=596 /DNA_ORIENTATION=-
MSWQDYIDGQLLRAGFCYASIVGFDGSCWASSQGYVILPDEAKRFASLLAGTSLDSLSAAGFTAAGQKYAFTRGEVNDPNGSVPFIQGRCKEDGKSSQGIIIMKTTQALIVGVHDPAYSNGASFGSANTAIGRIADYFVESGF